MSKNKNQKRILFGITIVATVTLMVGLLAMWNPLNKLQLKLTNRLYTANDPSPEIVIVGIDEKSLSEESGLGRWNQWDRLVYKQVIENLEKKGAAVIGMDIVFSESSKGISQTVLDHLNQKPESLSENIKEYSNTPHPSDIALSKTFEKYENIFLAKLGDRLREDRETIVNPAEPIDVFRENANVAWAVLYADEDDVARRFYPQLFDQKANEWDKTFALKIAEYKNGGDLNPVLNGDGTYLINYQATSRKFKEISFIDAYKGIFNEDLQGKIVLIGATTERLKDSWSTPRELGTLMPGVEIHANAIQTLLEGTFLREQSVGPQIGIMAVLTTLMTFLVMFFGILPGLGAAFGMIVLYHLTAKPLFDQGLIINLIYPTIALFCAYLFTTLYKYLVETREKFQLKGAFAKYVNKDLVNKILEDPDALKLGGAKRIITVFFSDIANFTHFSEGTTPEKVVEQLNEYFDVMVGIILKNGGTLNKFEGDAIMAFWGAPLDQADHAMLAARSALECRAALQSLHTRWGQEGKPLLDFRIGLSSGEAIAGNMGSSDRLEYTVMGDIVNLGSRLEAANKVYGTHIMISGETQALLGEAFELRRLDRLRVKGKDQPVDVYELLAGAGQLSDDQKKIINIFHQAIEYYRNGKFDDAIARFNEVGQAWPSDGPTQTYLKRCTELKATPPTEGWDGSWTLMSK